MTSPLFSNLPSVNDLLQSAPLRYLSETLSRNVVVDGVRAFLGKLQTEFSTAARDLELPSPNELASRIAEWLKKEEANAARPAINATGFIFSDQLHGPPWAEEALARWNGVGRGYSVSPATVNQAELLGREAARLVGGEAGLVVATHAGAIGLALRALSPSGEATVARSDIGTIEPGRTLADLASGCGVRLREIGTVGQTTLADYQASLPASQGLLLLSRRADLPAVGATPDLAELVALARERSALTLVDAGVGPLVDVAAMDLPAAWNLAPLFKAGVDVVLLRGEGLVGGPPCGLILGSESAIARIAAHPLGTLLRPDRATLSATAAAIQLARDPARAREGIPALSLAATTMANLEFRAGRLAQQLAALPCVAAAETQRGETWLTPAKRPSDRLETFQVILSPQGESSESLTARLRNARPALLATVVGERVQIDLRSVLAREDLEIARVFEAL